MREAVEMIVKGWLTTCRRDAERSTAMVDLIEIRVRP